MGEKRAYKSRKPGGGRKKLKPEYDAGENLKEQQLSKASVTSYLPYQKGVYFPSTADKEKISVGAERRRRYRAVRKLKSEPTEEHLWETVLLCASMTGEATLSNEKNCKNLSTRCKTASSGLHGSDF